MAHIPIEEQPWFQKAKEKLSPNECVEIEIKYAEIDQNKPGLIMEATNCLDESFIWTATGDEDYWCGLSGKID